MAKTTLGAVVNAGLAEIKEPALTAFDSENILQQRLIDEANNAVTEIMARARYRWGLKRTTLTTAAPITTGTVAVTNGSTTVTSKDASGVDADNFGSVAAGQYFRVTGDETSYQIDSVDTSLSPDTATLETAYVGTTATAASYTILQDEYSVSDTDFGELRVVGFGEAVQWYSGVPGSRPRAEVKVVEHRTLFDACGGDFHRDESGKPVLVARQGSDSSNNPVFKLWPYPDAQYVMEFWYTPKFSVASDFATTVMGGDAPDLAYVAVEARVCAAACRWDNDSQNQAYWEGRYSAIKNELVREGTTLTDNSMTAQTYRTYGGRSIRGESQHYFDVAAVRLR